MSNVSKKGMQPFLLYLSNPSLYVSTNIVFQKCNLCETNTVVYLISLLRQLQLNQERHSLNHSSCSVTFPVEI